MTSNAQLALVGASGVGYTADTGTAAPTGFTALPAAWNDMGYISQDGMTAAVSEERQSWTPWGALSPIRTQVTSSTKTFAVTCWETNKTVMSLYYKLPQSVMAPDSSTGIISFAENDKPSPDRRAFVFDIMDGSTNLIRLYIPLGEVTEKGDVVYKSDDLVGYPITISAYPGTDGVSVYRSYKLAALTS
jgi:hypothetical protein